MFRKNCIFVGFLLLLVGAWALPFGDVPAPTNFLNDYSGALSSDQINELNLQLKSISDDSNVEIGVWLIDSTGGKPISDYALELGNKFGVGNKGRFDGIVILVAVEDREYFIATAKGAETIITDIEVRGIELNRFDPNFKKGDFFTGLSLAISDFNNLNSDFLGARAGDVDPNNFLLLFIILIVIAGVFIFLFVVIDSDSGYSGGSIGGTGGYSGRSYSGGSSYSSRSSKRSSDDSSSSSGGFSGGFGGFGGGGGFSGGGCGGKF